MVETSSIAAKLTLLGGAVCLDFANTVSDHKNTQVTDYLTNYFDLVAWSQHAGILASRDAQQLIKQAEQTPTAANNVFRRAIALREAIYRIFTAVATKQSPKIGDLDLLSESIASAYGHGQIVSQKDGFGWEWSDDNALDRMLWEIARSAGDLLTLGNVDRVRQCNDEVCGWLFIDTSKNHSRRWCAMQDCGNRAKARRFYKRNRNSK